jgi:hypothetical protein
LVVLVVDGLAVVDVVDGTVVVVPAAVVGVVVVPPAAVVGVEVGTVTVGVDGLAVVVVTGAVPETVWTRARTVEAGTLGTDVVAGTKATVISWLLANLRAAGLAA